MCYKVKQTKTNLQKYFHPSSLNQLIALRTCNAESQRRSAKGSSFKDDDRALTPLEVTVLLFTKVCLWCSVLLYFPFPLLSCLKNINILYLCSSLLFIFFYSVFLATVFLSVNIIIIIPLGESNGQNFVSSPCNI